AQAIQPGTRTMVGFARIVGQGFHRHRIPASGRGQSPCACGRGTRPRRGAAVRGGCRRRGSACGAVRPLPG
ncbi:MAG: hypothetical protein ACK559_20940, partial [bacterium]